jgi:uncharacterized membrane protein (Fun14 family)
MKMTIATDIETKLKNNQHIVYITDADDLLAAWRYKRQSSSKRSKNLSMAPTKWRYSAPTNNKSPFMPCHVSYRRKAGLSVSEMKPAYEYSTISCHGHGRMDNISVPDLDTLEAVTYAKRNFSPWVSPIMDAYTLTLVCKDLGINGKAIPKMINGRQYIAFSGYPGLRTRFPGTIYSAKNRKIINMAIGALGIKNMVKNGGFITFYVTVPLTILEAFLKDHKSCYELAGNIASDLIKIGIGALMGFIVGVAIGEVVAYAAVPIGLAILAMVITGYSLDYLDDQYLLTNKLIAVLENMGEKAEGMTYEAQSTIYHGLWNFLRSSGLKAQIY